MAQKRSPQERSQQRLSPQKRRFALPLAILLTISIGSAVAQTAAPSRLTGNWSNSPAVMVPRSEPPVIISRTDLGAAPANAPMGRMLLLLSPSPAEQQALTAELASLENPASPSYHQWLTPTAFANAYANSASDVAAVAAWLGSEGFTVAPLPASRGWIEFSGTAAQVEQAFHTQVHSFSTPGGTRAALAGSISVPGALAPLVEGLVSLDGAVSTPALTTPEPLTVSASVLAAKTSSNGVPALSPELAAPLLHLDTVHANGIDGAGETIAIVASSNVSSADVAAFRSAFGLPASALKVVPDGPDPGLTVGQAEATLEASWAGAAAPGAEIVLVPVATTAATDGADLSLADIVDQDLAQIVAVGYSDCESGMSAAHQAFYSAVYRQAAAEGIAIVAAAGDSGAAACHVPGSIAPVISGLAVNALASTPWNTAVGVVGFGAAGPSAASSSANDSALAAWSPLSAADPAYAGGGGSSTLYAAPAWQPVPPQLSQGAGDIGVHNRLMPDLALPTAIDANSNLGLAFCLSGAASAPDAATDAATSTGAASGCTLVRAGGSSAATAIFAGIAALIDQKYGPQGNLAPNLYLLSRQSGVFTDVEEGSAQLPCAASSPGCGASGQIGYTASAGYDLATGLGVPNAQSLITDWAKPEATGTGTVNVTFTSPAPGVTFNPSAQIPFTVNVTPTTPGTEPSGSVELLDTTTGLNFTATVDTAGNASYTTAADFFAQGSHQIQAQYSGDGNYAATNSASQLDVNIQPSTGTLVLAASNSKPAPGSTITVTAT
ncbi:MAG: protease pro-enzyme activation domain-containing protein, partial [Terracidiphilus sp.]